LRHGKGHGALRRERERAPKGTKELGAKIEIKNMNSFSGVRRALEYEIPRQIEVVKAAAS
jgi:Asp-tRNA(Asn)/Glu-tRNA(Gln) amidotransferase B subunit